MWFYSALIAAFLNALMDFFVKISSGKIQNALGGTLLTSAAAITMFGITLYSKNKGEAMNITWSGAVFSISAGLSVGVATFFIYKMFDNNTNLSIAIPFLRVCIILFSILFGILFLRENISLKLALGVTLSLIGLYFILSPSLK